MLANVNLLNELKTNTVVTDFAIKIDIVKNNSLVVDKWVMFSNHISVSSVKLYKRFMPRKPLSHSVSSLWLLG